MPVSIVRGRRFLFLGRVSQFRRERLYSYFVLRRWLSVKPSADNTPDSPQHILDDSPTNQSPRQGVLRKKGSG